MKDYYKILGLTKDANAEEVKTAYKTLALKYHPDRNEGSTAAEEQFKNVNEAYQVLSDSYKKEKYDLIYDYGSKSKTNSSYQPYQTYKDNSNNQRPNYAKYDWKNRPNYQKAKVYKVDKNYYRLQLYTIIGVLIVIAIIASGNIINDHYAEKRAKEEAINIAMKLNRAEIHFTKDQYDSTFQIILQLIRDYPIDAVYSNYREEYVNKIHQKGIQYFQQNEYVRAIHELNSAKKYIRNQDLDIWTMIGDCHNAIGSYQKAIDAFDYVFIRKSSNIDLALKIGDLYLKLDDKQNALNYYTSAKNIFKDRQSAIYGKAFELVVRPNTLDNSYFHIFNKRGQLNYELANFEEATTDYNWAIFLKPQFLAGYSKRAECWLRLGNNYRACLDWKEAYLKGDKSVLSRISQYCGT